MEKNELKEIISVISTNKMLLKLKKSMYQKEAIFSSAYKFTDLCTILIKPLDEETVGVYFENKKDQVDLKKLAKKYCNEILDQQVRLDLEKKYGNIRELIYQQAFAPMNNLKEKIKI